MIAMKKTGRTLLLFAAVAVLAAIIAVASIPVDESEAGRRAPGKEWNIDLRVDGNTVYIGENVNGLLDSGGAMAPWFFMPDEVDTVVVGTGVTELGDALANCFFAKTIILPESLSKISEWSFSGCTELQRIDLPSTLTEIPSNAFFNCQSLTGMQIPTSVTSIGEDAFRGCVELMYVNFSELTSLSSIGDGAFYACYQLQNIKIPASVRTIGDSAFFGCNSVKEIHFLGDSWNIESIGNGAFGLGHVDAKDVHSFVVSESNFANGKLDDASNLLTQLEYVSEIPEFGPDQEVNVSWYDAKGELIYTERDVTYSQITFDGINHKLPELDERTFCGWYVECNLHKNLVTMTPLFTKGELIGIGGNDGLGGSDGETPVQFYCVIGILTAVFVGSLVMNRYR